MKLLQRLTVSSAFAFAAIAHAQPVPATSVVEKQKEPPVEKELQLETFYVTGTLIKRSEQEGSLPVLSVGKDFLETRDALTPVEIIATLPQIPNVPQNESANGGATQRGDFSSVNLRGIGSGNTLVLLNNRRLATHPMSSADSTAGRNFVPNINQLPTRGIQQIDVLRDGASALYGSDAVAGAVNFITDDSFRGSAVNLKYRMPEYGGNQSFEAAVTHGAEFAGGRGSFIATIDYIYRDMLFLRDRPFSANVDHSFEAPPPFNVVGSAYDRRSATIGYWPRFRIGSSTAAAHFYPLGAIGTVSVPVLTATAPTRAATPKFYENVNENNTALPRSNRINFLARSTYDLIPQKVAVFGEVLYYEARSTLRRSPSFLNAPSPDFIQVMSADNPYNPYGSRFFSPTGTPNGDGTQRLVGTPQSLSFLSYQAGELPFKLDDKSEVFRTVAGLRGKIGETWNWETAFLFTSAFAGDYGHRYERESRLAEALARTDSQALNPFHYTFKVENGAVVADKPYANPASVTDYTYQTFSHEARTWLMSGDFRVSGELFKIWSGAVSLAAGGDIRRESFDHNYAPYSGLNPPGSGLDPLNNDFVVQSPVPDSRGKRSVRSLFAEALIPLASPENKIPLVKSFELSASVRREEYPVFGANTSPKYSVNWRPFTGAMLRASYNEGFAAPNLDTLNSPQTFTTTGAPGIIDDYRNPTTQESSYIMKVNVGGNPSLRPMLSKGRSAGLVLDVPKVKGLNLSVDYWEIEQTDIIGTVSRGLTIQRDAAALLAFIASERAKGVAGDNIDVGAGTPSYKGDPLVNRLAPSAQDRAVFAAYNAANPNNQRAPVGRIDSLDERFTNLSVGFTSGLDFSLSYRLPYQEFGTFAFNVDWTHYLEKYTYIPVEGQAPRLSDQRPAIGIDRGNLMITWRKGPWSANAGAYYEDEGLTASVTEAQYLALGEPSYIKKWFSDGRFNYNVIVEDVWSYNASVARRFNKPTNRWVGDTTIRFGVVNLTDERPPLTSDSQGYNTDRHNYLAPGRTYTFEISRKF